MVKRKWLWGKKSSEKINSETESLSSMSSNSDKLSEDQEPYKGSPTITQSQDLQSKATDSEIDGEDTKEKEQRLTPELLDIPGIEDGSSKEDAFKLSVDAETLSDSFMEDGSKDCREIENASTISEDENRAVKIAVHATNDCKEDNVSFKLLTEKLSAALVNVSLKDDLVKQHSKVAEEAVAGWEKAENEAAALEQQLEATMQNKSALEARVSHLDEALKECVRQLRLARDEQDRKINQAITEKTNEFEIAKTRLEDQLVELQAMVETFRRMKSPDLELQHKIEYLERENEELRKEFQSVLEELEVRTIERDLSTKAAESASKQHLESIKKVARLEAECRKLKSFSRVSPSSIEHKSSTAAASCAETLTDNQSDGAEQLSSSESDSHMNGSWASALIAELDHFKSEKVVEKNKHSSSKGINLMDDFLEMERLAALPDTGPQIHSVGCEETPEKAVHEADNRLRIELESMVHRSAELEEIISKVEEEKAELVMALGQAQSCLEESQVQLIETQMKLDQLERELQGANEGEQFYKAQVISLERETNLMSSQIKSLHAEIRNEQALSEEKSARYEELESELKKKEEQLEIQKDAISSGELHMKEMALSETQDKLVKSENQLKQVEMKLSELEKELEEANEEKKSLNSELDSVREELQKMSSQIESLNEQVRKEQALVEELSTKSKEMEHELLRRTQELDAQQRAHSNNELKIKQEDLAIAAGKLADCQQTIASLGSQLKSLATLEDFLIDTASIPGFMPPAPLMARRNTEPWRLHSNDTYLSEKEYEPSSDTRENLSPFASHNRRDMRGSQASSSSSSTSSAFFMNYPGSEKNGNGFASYFSLSRN